MTMELLAMPAAGVRAVAAIRGLTKCGAGVRVRTSPFVSRLTVSNQAGEVVEIGRVAAYAGHVPAIQYTPAQHCCPCTLDCSIKNVFELGHYTGFLIRCF